MKIYQLETRFTFGKYSGKNLNEVLQEQPSYINWCLINLDHFLIWHNTLTQLKESFPAFRISKEAETALETKTEAYEEEQEMEHHRGNLRSDEYYRNPDPTDYTHYNDDLDADQQSEKFWNQF